MWGRLKCLIFLFLIFTCSGAEPCRGRSGLVIHARTAVDFELLGYDGLAVFPIYRGSFPAGESRNVETSYNGLALLVFSSGQKYPLIIGRETSDVIITSPDQPPSFKAGDGNHLFYALLAGEKAAAQGKGFARLMLQGKALLDSSSSIQSVDELRQKKAEFEEFVQSHYRELSRSDLLRRLLAQYFMMHEYVRYHLEASPAGGIRSLYHQEVLAGVESLLALLKEYLPENGVLNYCAGLYYNRGMVSLAALIAENFSAIATCGSEDWQPGTFPANLQLVSADGSAAGELGGVMGTKIFSFVSVDCPVSMTMTVIKAREIAEGKDRRINHLLIVVPLEKLSEKHRAIKRNVSGGRMLFVDDEVWRKKNLPKDIRLPFFVNIAQSKI